MSDTIFLCMLEGKLHALCAVAGISNERHQVRPDGDRLCLALQQNPTLRIITIPPSASFGLYSVGCVVIRTLRRP